MNGIGSRFTYGFFSCGSAAGSVGVDLLRKLYRLAGGSSVLGSVFSSFLNKKVNDCRLITKRLEVVL